MPGIDRCSDCGCRRWGFYAFWRPNKADWQPCTRCSDLRRKKQDIELEAQSERDKNRREQESRDKAETTRINWEKEKAHIEQDIQERKEDMQRKTKQQEYENHERSARAREEQEKEMEEKRIKESIKQLEVKARIEEATTSLLVAEEKTRQVKIENEERTKQEEQRTKQKLAQLTMQLVSRGFKYQEIESLMNNIFGSSQNDQRVASHNLNAAPSELQSRLLTY